MTKVYYGMAELEVKEIMEHFDAHTIKLLISNLKDDLSWIDNRYINCTNDVKNDLVRMEYFLDLSKNFQGNIVWDEVKFNVNKTDRYKNDTIDLNGFHQDMGEFLLKLSYVVAYDKLLKTQLCDALTDLIEPVAELRQHLSNGELNYVPYFFEEHYDKLYTVGMLTAYDEGTLKRALSEKMNGNFDNIQSQKEVFTFLNTFRMHDLNGYFGKHCNLIDCVFSCYEEDMLSNHFRLNAIEYALDGKTPEQVHILRELDKSVLLKMSESRPLYIEDMDKYFQSEKLGLNLGNYIVPSFMTMCEELGKSGNPDYEALVRWCGDYGVYEPNAKGETIMDAYLEMKDIALVTIGTDGGFMRTTITTLKGQEGREDNVKERVREYVIRDVMEEEQKKPSSLEVHYEEDDYEKKSWLHKENDGKEDDYEEPEFY